MEFSEEKLIKAAYNICYHTNTYTLGSNHLRCALKILYPETYEIINTNALRLNDDNKYKQYIKMAEGTLRNMLRQHSGRYPSKLSKDSIRYMAGIVYYHMVGELQPNNMNINFHFNVQDDELDV